MENIAISWMDDINKLTNNYLKMTFLSLYECLIVTKNLVISKILIVSKFLTVDKLVGKLSVDTNFFSVDKHLHQSKC